MAAYIHKSHEAAFKAKVAVEALKREKTMAELSEEATSELYRQIG